MVVAPEGEPAMGDEPAPEPPVEEPLPAPAPEQLMALKLM
jgi:hypothetical protein